MKRVLYITAFPPNERTGGQTFSLNAIRDLTRLYELDVWYFAYPGHTTPLCAGGNLKSVVEWPVERLGWLRRFWVHPAFSRRLNRTLIRRLRTVAGGYDCLFFDFSQVALLALEVEHPCKVLRLHDVLYQKYGRRNGGLARWVLGTERRAVRAVSRVFVPSPKDAELLRRVYGVEADYTHEYLKPVNLPPDVPQERRMLFYGYWRRPENRDGLLWFLREVYPLLPRGTVRLAVMGAGLSADFVRTRLAPLGVRYLGFTENPIEEILKSEAVLVPLFQGAGVKVKVIDAFSAGMPVIGTELAFEGLPDMPRLVRRADTARRFAESVIASEPLSYADKLALRQSFLALYDQRHLAERLNV